MVRSSSHVWTLKLEKDGEEKSQGLFLILLILEEGGTLVSFERFYRCDFGPGEWVVCELRHAKTLSVPLLLPDMGLLGLEGAGKFCARG